METKFNHEQSLALISEMISRARDNVQKERTYPIIYWGYTIAIVAFSNFALLHLLPNPNMSFLVWLVTIPAAVVSFFIDRKIDRTALVKTHIDKIGDTVWKGFGITVVIFLITIYAVAIRLELPRILILITPVIMLMVGIGQFATACIYRYKPWYWIAVLFWTGAVACAFSQQDIQFIILAVCMILGYVIPGHRLLRQEKESHV